MNIGELKLINWRNYQDASFVFEPGVNLLIGDNAMGKTNVLEALVWLATTKSFRTNRERAVIKRGESFAKVIGSGAFDNRESYTHEQRIITEIGKETKKTILLNGLETKAGVAVGNLKVILFSPEEIDHFFGWPKVRRRWIDLAIAMVDRQYIYQMAYYKKIVSGRNAVLRKIKEGRGGYDEIFFWNDKWAETASVIVEKRKYFIESIVSAKEIFNKIFDGRDKMKVEYVQFLVEGFTKEKYLNWAKNNFDKEIRQEKTLCGPHRDDVTVKINGIKAQDWGSRAQLRLSLLSMKMAEAKYIEYNSGEKPIAVLDDIFSELDEINVEKVFWYFKDRQVLATSARREKVKGNVILIGDNK